MSGVDAALNLFDLESRITAIRELTPMFSPKPKGDLPTASKQARRLERALRDRGSLPREVAADMASVCTRAQCWLVLTDARGERRPVPTKFGSHDKTPEEYSRQRTKLWGTEGADLIAQWAKPASLNDAAFEVVRTFCESHGLEPRAKFRVMTAKDVDVAEDDKRPLLMDRTIGDLIVAILPHLDSEQRRRIASEARIA